MTIDELRKALAAMPGDAVVRLWCDHGQVSMKASTITKQRMDPKDRDAWMVEESYSNDDFEDDSPPNVVEIGAP